MIPITKNMIVVDEFGNEYEATYPKRARGLVKNGRARFISDNKICLACPPDKLEDNQMSDRYNNTENETSKSIKADEPVEAAETAIPNIKACSKPDEKRLSIDYVLVQIEKITEQTAYLNRTIEALMSLPPSTSDKDSMGKEQAISLGDVVRCRETTNQQLLRFYEKIYDDLKEKNHPSTIITRFEDMSNFLCSLNRKDFTDDCWNLILEAAEGQLGREYPM